MPNQSTPICSLCRTNFGRAVAAHMDLVIPRARTSTITIAGCSDHSWHAHAGIGAMLMMELELPFAVDMMLPSDVSVETRWPQFIDEFYYWQLSVILPTL